MKIKNFYAVIAVSVLGIFTIGCKTNKEQPSTTPSTDIALVRASASAVPSAPVVAEKPKLPGSPYAGEYTSTYKAEPTTITAPDKHSANHWKDAGTQWLGAGTVTLTVDPQTRAIHGTSQGALGDLIVSGELQDSKEPPVMSINLKSKDPTSENAMSGVLIATLDGTAFKGKIHVSNRTADVARVAKVRIRLKSKLVKLI
jgi:hypothetical protein